MGIIRSSDKITAFIDFWSCVMLALVGDGVNSVVVTKMTGVVCSICMMGGVPPIEKGGVPKEEWMRRQIAGMIP